MTVREKKKKKKVQLVIYHVVSSDFFRFVPSTILERLHKNKIILKGRKSQTYLKQNILRKKLHIGFAFKHRCVSLI